jgi:PPOX class probable F420-dependent enzyme
VSDPFPAFARRQFLRLTTFRRSGEGVPTPVWFAELDGGLGVFTAAQAGKVKRIRRDGRVRIAPCTFKGRPKGEEQEAVAHLVAGEAAERIHEALEAKYGWMFRMVTRRRPEHAYIEITPAAG